MLQKSRFNASVKMKPKATVTCKRDEHYPHVSQKSNKICKLSLSKVRGTDEKGNLAISCQTSQNDFCKIEELSNDHDNKGDSGQSCPSFNGCTDSRGQTCLSFDELTDSVDSLLSSPSSSYEMMLTSLGNQFDAVHREQNTWVPQENENFLDHFPMSDDAYYYAYDLSQTGFPSDEMTLFDPSKSYDCLSDILLAETNLINGYTEGDMVLPALEETIGVANLYHGGPNGEFQQVSGSSIFNFTSHQANPFTGELHVNYSQLGSDRVDNLDQETFVKNFLESSDEANNSLPALISQETSKQKKVTLVLDLDETLVHSTIAQCEGDADFTYQMLGDKQCTAVYVQKRPFLQEFLERVSEMFEIIIFTASKCMYAGKLLDILDPDKKFFSRRVYRESCTFFEDEHYVKDLTILGIDLAKVFIVDNTPQVFRFQVNNGIPIKSWYNDPEDAALISLVPFLEKLVDVDDVRPIIAQEYGAKN